MAAEAKINTTGIVHNKGLLSCELIIISVCGKPGTEGVGVTAAAHNAVVMVLLSKVR